MVTRACISINNRCNLNCTYCHFHEKKDYIQEDNMDVITILDIITSHIEDNDIDLFKLGFVGNGEPMLDYEKLKQYIAHIGDYLKSGRIAAYTITNGLLVDREKLEFFKEYNVNVGFSVDGISAIHDKYRCGLIRYVRGALLDALSMDYVRTARAKGLKEKTVIYKHAFRNAMIPITGWIVGSIVGIFGGAVIIETLFSWKGVGKLLIDSLNQHDYTVALSMQMFYILLGLAANLITDLCYCIVDPRIKLD